MKESIQPINLIEASISIAEAIERLEETAIKFLILINRNKEVCGCLTDGDIRRGLIKGISLDGPAMTVANKSPIVIPNQTPTAKIRAIFVANNIDYLIQVDELNRPKQLLQFSDFAQLIPLSTPHMGTTEANFVERAFDENYIAPVGSNLNEFEKLLAEECGKAHVLATNNGTAAIHLALRVLDVQTNDRVYCSDNTFIGSLHPVLYQNATPVLIDSEYASWNMCPRALLTALKADQSLNRLPKAIIAVHIYGQPANIEVIKEIADQFDVPIIEDCAESLGATVRGKRSGSHGVISVFSFNGNKIITTSGGGALATNNQQLMLRARKLASQGRENSVHYEHTEIGYNYRMSNVLAGIGLGQLNVLHDRIARRREIFDQYKMQLEHYKGIQFQHDLPGSEGNRWLTVIRITPHCKTLSPKKAYHALKDVNIESRPAWKPMHMQPIARNFEFIRADQNAIVSRDLYYQSLCLPSGSNLTDDHVDSVIQVLKGHLETKTL